MGGVRLRNPLQSANSEHIGGNPQGAWRADVAHRWRLMKALDVQKFDYPQGFIRGGGRPFANARVAMAAALWCALWGGAANSTRAESANLDAIKTYLVTKVATMDKAAHEYVADATAYEKMIAGSGGDYSQAVLKNGEGLLGLIAKMQGVFRVYHNFGYETIEGITAGTKLIRAIR